MCALLMFLLAAAVTLAAGELLELGPEQTVSFSAFSSTVMYLLVTVIRFMLAYSLTLSYLTMVLCFKVIELTIVHFSLLGFMWVLFTVRGCHTHWQLSTV